MSVGSTLWDWKYKSLNSPKNKKINLNKKRYKKMVGKCVYCKAEISDDRAVEVCNRCGVMVWGEKMFNTILQNMGDAKARDDLCSTNLDPKKIY